MTAAELLAAARARTAAVNPRINAVVRRLDAEADARAGAPETLRGPFAGVPFLIKDLAQDYAGLPTSSGSRSLASLPMPEHATVVERWLGAGLVIFGKTNTPEFGAKGITESELLGPARNPWNLAHTTGGSSGGAAAAVAAGIVPVAGASDGGGSIRIPAACCGLFGLKPGRGLVPTGPARGEGLQRLGDRRRDLAHRPRHRRDARRARRARARRRPTTSPTPPTPFADAVGQDPGRLRIGVCTASAIPPGPASRGAGRDDARPSPRSSSSATRWRSCRARRSTPPRSRRTSC